MQKGAGSTQAQEATILTVNQKPVKNTNDLKTILDSLEPGANVSLAFQSKGRNLVIDGVVKQK